MRQEETAANQNERDIILDSLNEGVLTVCLLYTSDAADHLPCVDLGGRRHINKKKTNTHHPGTGRPHTHITPPY